MEQRGKDGWALVLHPNRTGTFRLVGGGPLARRSPVAELRAVRVLWLLVLPVMGSASPAMGQAVRQKHLVTSLGGGGGTLSMSTSMDSLAVARATSGAVRFSFGYALGDRWSLGAHYHRIGTDRAPGAVQLLRFTSYMVEGSWRPWTGRKATVEAMVALGGSIMALRPHGSRLPLGSAGGVASMGLRYMHLVGGTLGVFVAAEHSASSTHAITFDGEEVMGPEGSPHTAAWDNQRVTAGLLMRF